MLVSEVQLAWDVRADTLATHWVELNVLLICATSFASFLSSDPKVTVKSLLQKMTWKAILLNSVKNPAKLLLLQAKWIVLVLKTGSIFTFLSTARH